MHIRRRRIERERPRFSFSFPLLLVRQKKVDNIRYFMDFSSTTKKSSCCFSLHSFLHIDLSLFLVSLFFPLHYSSEQPIIGTKSCVGTGPLARSFARLLSLLTHFTCSALLTSLARFSWAHSFVHSFIHLSFTELVRKRFLYF